MWELEAERYDPNRKILMYKLNGRNILKNKARDV